MIFLLPDEKDPIYQDDWNEPARLEPLLESIGKVDQVIADRSQQLLVLQGSSG
jgi:hypothetical protein